MPLIAALTPAEIHVHHTDEIVEPIDFERQADLVAITCNTPAANRAYRLAAEFRRRGRTVVLGGPHVTALPQEALAHADSVLLDPLHLRPTVPQVAHRALVERPSERWLPPGPAVERNGGLR